MLHAEGITFSVMRCWLSGVSSSGEGDRNFKMLSYPNRIVRNCGSTEEEALKSV
jgi:hypothetical protein